MAKKGLKSKKESVAAEKTTFYGVRSWYYDSGIVYKRGFEEQRESIPLNYFTRGEKTDMYVEYFETKTARDSVLFTGKTSADEIAERSAGTSPKEQGDGQFFYYTVLQSNAKKESAESKGEQ